MAEHNVVYLLGAGASYGIHYKQDIGIPRCRTLPIVSEMPTWIEYAKCQLISSFKESNIDANIKTHDDLIRYCEGANLLGFSRLISAFEVAEKACRVHQSIDTYAKKLFLTQKHDDLYALKLVMSLCFQIWESFQDPDQRYDTFFASLLDRRLKMPDNVKVVSWNYDMQYERAHLAYIQGGYPMNGYDDVSYKGFRPNNGSTLVKLNGSAWLIADHGKFKYHKDKLGKISIEFARELGLVFETCYYPQHLQTLISFAWEVTENSDNVVDVAKNHFKSADSIVVIGYTFPFYNRKVDRQLFEQLKVRPVEVVIQDPDAPNLVNKLRNVFSDIDNLTFTPLTYCDQFHIPYNL